MNLSLVTTWMAWGPCPLARSSSRPKKVLVHEEDILVLRALSISCETSKRRLNRQERGRLKSLEKIHPSGTMVSEVVCSSMFHSSRAENRSISTTFW